MRDVLFWDIDGTLLSTARAGVFALEEAAREVCGTDASFSSLKTAGLTDSEVAERVIEACGGHPSPRLVTDFLRAYERHLPDRLHWRRGAVLPGVVEVLNDLARRPHVACLLLTGNTPAGARAKLSHYGIAHYFDDGVFCADGDDRNAIARRAPEVARRRADGSLESSSLFVIGDTPEDVKCAQAIGARSVAIASGQCSLEALQACGPWLSLLSLPTPQRFAEALGLT